VLTYYEQRGVWLKPLYLIRTQKPRFHRFVRFERREKSITYLESIPSKGTIPSLDTIFATSYKPSSQRLRSKTFQTRGGFGHSHPRIVRNLGRSSARASHMHLHLGIGIGTACRALQSPSKNLPESCAGKRLILRCRNRPVSPFQKQVILEGR